MAKLVDVYPGQYGNELICAQLPVAASTCCEVEAWRPDPARLPGRTRRVLIAASLGPATISTQEEQIEVAEAMLHYRLQLMYAPSGVTTQTHLIELVRLALASEGSGWALDAPARLKTAMRRAARKKRVVMAWLR